MARRRDVIDHDDWRYRTAQITKQNAAKNLKYLEVHGSAPSTGQPDANALYEQALAAGDAQEYEKGIRLLDACLWSNPDPVIAVTGFFNLFVMIQLQHNFANRHGDSVPNDEFRWFCRMVLCVKKAIEIYETQLATSLTGEALEEVKAIMIRLNNSRKRTALHTEPQFAIHRAIWTGATSRRATPRIHFHLLVLKKKKDKKQRKRCDVKPIA